MHPDATYLKCVHTSVLHAGILSSVELHMYEGQLCDTRVLLFSSDL